MVSWCRWSSEQCAVNPRFCLGTYQPENYQLAIPRIGARNLSCIAFHLHYRFFWVELQLGCSATADDSWRPWNLPAVGINFFADNMRCQWQPKIQILWESHVEWWNGTVWHFGVRKKTLRKRGSEPGPCCQVGGALVGGAHQRAASGNVCRQQGTLNGAHFGFGFARLTLSCSRQSTIMT